MKNCKIFLLSFLISCATLFCYAKEDQTLLVFSADWCKYCNVAKNDMKNNESVLTELKQYSIIELDYDKDKDFVQGHNIKIIPTFIIFKDGKEQKRMTGYKGPNSLINFLK